MNKNTENKKLVKCSVYIDELDYKVLNELAIKQDRSVSYLLRRLVKPLIEIEKVLK